MNKSWDLNIFFEDLGHDENGINQWSDVITINPVIYTARNEYGGSENLYTNIIWKTTFAEARWIRSQRPSNEYGDDWSETLEQFLEIAPPRIKSLLGTLPHVDEYQS